MKIYLKKFWFYLELFLKKYFKKCKGKIVENRKEVSQDLFYDDNIRRQFFILNTSQL